MSNLEHICAMSYGIRQLELHGNITEEEKKKLIKQQYDRLMIEKRRQQ